ncbi:MAG: transglycosylase SLT domain-containing protein [Alphaproteobacteria bacterium]|nr:transglycosylase SLT domain-containing protein [Alphaproteobacteria bacterium]
MRGRGFAIILCGTAIALLAAIPAEAASKTKPQVSPEILKQAIEGKTGSLQLVTFPNTGWSAVKVVRGGAPARDKTAQKTPAEKAEAPEIITFADPQRAPVRVLRGDSERGAGISERLRAGPAMTMQVVTFADLRNQTVSILRGSGFQAAAETELFGPASAADLGRVAFAVDGAESSHGADLRMWRPEPSGPQGPMQVTAAAALDVGGGDRFDLTENRALGRAYLGRMYQRYGNWPDAVAAYNWGPRNLDTWIGDGRAADKLPLMVERYRNRVLREAALAEPGITTAAASAGRSRPHTPPEAVPAPPPAAAAIADALQRGAAAGKAAFREFAAAVRNSAGNWKSAYARLGDRILALSKERSPKPPSP